MGRNKNTYEILSERSLNVFLRYGNILMSVDTFQRKLVALHNIKSEKKITKRILNAYYDIWYEKLVELYKKEFEIKLKKIVRFRLIKASASYETDCMLIERIGDIK